MLEFLSAQVRCPTTKEFSHIGMDRAFPSARFIPDTLWVPVVFHLIAQDSGGWLEERRIAAQVRALNRDFAAAGIQFYLPRYGPQGQPTCGVTRHLSPLAVHDWTFQEDTLKSLVCWPPDSFLNIWVVDEMVLSTIGYARVLGDSEGTPGVVLIKSVVGDKVGVQPPFDWGRTAVHEIGHVFSLYHPFEGGCVGMNAQTCAIEGDEICDTPPQSQPHYGCPPLTTNTCHEAPPDLFDPVDNFMGYVDDECMTRFTSLQIQRMREFLFQVGAVLISEENQQARGRNEPFLSGCAAVASLSYSLPSFHIRQAGHSIFMEAEESISLILLDAMGRMILKKEGNQFFLSNLPVGLYIAVVEVRGKPLFFRFFVI
ncbi:MAG: zinc metalloprotease [Bacteroidia bacterium]|nr:zinc metalloprotease [Bacteroidia bacterium]